MGIYYIAWCFVLAGVSLICPDDQGQSGSPTGQYWSHYSTRAIAPMSCHVMIADLYFFWYCKDTNMVHWPPLPSEVELRSPWSWLGKEKGTKKAGIVAGLVHVQLHGVWRSFQNCNWSCLYLILVLCQLKEIGRCDAVMQSVVLNFSCLSDVLSNVSSLF